MSVRAVEALFASGNVLVPESGVTEEQVFQAIRAEAAAARERRAETDPKYVAQHPLDESYGGVIARRICAARGSR